VLIGGFDAIATLGLREVLDQEGFELVPDTPHDSAASADSSIDVLRRLISVRPDVVVLDLDVDQGANMAEEISRRFPAIKVIACSAREPLMRVYPPFHHGDYYVSMLSASLLADAVRS
jgi:DNA-binding NarL/FixJ family response regulator